MLTETSQGSNSGQSATHDSDPRKLGFETVGFLDNLVDDLGTLADLTKCLPLGSTAGTAGPTLNDLSDGGATGATITFESAIPTVPTDLDVGDMHCRMYLTKGELVDLQIFDITMPALRALMAAQPVSINGYKIDITTMLDEWEAHLADGWTLTGMDFLTVTSFGADLAQSPVRLRSMFGPLSFGADRLHDANFTDSITGDASTIVFTPDTGMYGVHLEFNPVIPAVGDRLYLNLVELNIDGSTTTNLLTIPIDMVNQKSVASPAQLASQHLDGETGDQPQLLIPFNFPHAVSYITTNELPVIFGIPDTTGFSNVTFDYGSTAEGYTAIVQLSYANFPVVDVQDYHDYPIPAEWSTHANLRIGIYLYPTSIPAVYNNILCTKPYELRLRNNPAFRLNFIRDPSQPVPESDLTINVAMLVSQGEVDGETLWTKCVMQMFGNQYGDGVVGDLIPLNFPATLAWLPKNWQGDIVQIAKSTTDINGGVEGPWNYIRLFFMNPVDDEGHLQDYTGWKLEITANAREL